MQIVDALDHYFGYESFRPGQLEIIQAILNKQDTLAILPTGGGKSICYQLPALMLPGLTLVISPLISLMKDQVDSLKQLDIDAAYINSSLTDSQYFATMQQLRSGQLKLLYVAPERLTVPNFVHELLQYPIEMIAVDEAHCVSQWGHDFRPSYRTIHEFIEQFPTSKRPTIAAFTATATRLVQEDIVTQLNLNQPEIFVNSFDRPNIKFTVETPTNKYQALKDRLNSVESIIIYAQTRRNVDDLFDRLQRDGYQVAKYHAGLSDDTRLQSQEDFINDRKNIIVATNAFGMGIDKTDVRLVIHYHLPTSLENYYQEAGRGGRDGLPAEAVLFFARQDIMGSRFLIENSQDPNIRERLEIMIRYANLTTCLRNYILRYFGEIHEKPCGNCSSCLHEFEIEDATIEAQMILSCIVRLKYHYGMTMVADVLRGSRKQLILDRQYDKLSTYGLMRNYSKNTVLDLISALIAQNYLSVNEHRGLILTPNALQILKDNTTFYVKKTRRTSMARPRALTPQDSTNETLYEDLRDLRAQIAKEERLPAYIVLNNKTLVELSMKEPITKDELLAINGIGPVKANKYGDRFIQVIKNYQKKTTKSSNK